MTSPVADRNRGGPSRPDFAEVKTSYPLLDVVERAGVHLKRSGTNRFLGRCPFHEDRTPSFFVYLDRQRFVCYGCKTWGDVLDFVRLHEHLATVGEACAWLTGTPVPPPRAERASEIELKQRDRRWDRLTLEEQEDLAAILRRRLAERGRKQLAQDVHEARQEFAAGGCRPLTPGELMDEILT